MTKEELQKILDNHKLWVSDSTKGQRANLRDANLRDANLRDANLRGAYLSNTNLSNADLVGANLSNANLRNADLSGANLIGADLRDAYLNGTNLRDAYLSGAYLDNTCVFIFTLGAHFGFAHFGEQYKDDSYVKIGCGGQSLVDWLENYKAIGKNNGYTDEQIKDYGDFLKYLAKRKP